MSNEMKRHVGRIRSTEQRCVVVFMQIPGREDYALVINTESLPPLYEHSLMSVLETQEAQTTQDLGTILSRRVMPDTGVDVLNTFHQAHLLRPEPIDNIIMLPRPNMPFPLRQVLESLGKSLAPQPPEMAAMGDPPKYNPYLTNQSAQSAEQKLGIAKNIVIEAEMLENEARHKREQAYALAPEMRPSMMERVKKATEKPPESKTKFNSPGDVSSFYSANNGGDKQPAGVFEDFTPPGKLADQKVSDATEPAKRRGPGRPRKSESR